MNKNFYTLLSILFALTTLLNSPAQSPSALALTIFEQYPTSIEDFSCGQWLVGAKFKTTPDGMDQLVFYPDTDREFMIPILKVPVEKALQLNGIVAIFSIDYPELAGKKQGNFYFKKVEQLSSLEQIYKSPTTKTGKDCQLR